MKPVTFYTGYAMLYQLSNSVVQEHFPTVCCSACNVYTLKA